MASNVRAVIATQELIDQIKGRLRKADKIECFACGHDPDMSLQKGFETSVLCFVGMVGDEPVICFGLAQASLLGTVGIPWMVGTDSIKKISRGIVQRSRQVIGVFLDMYPYLENYVHTENKISIRWLKWCGFTLESPTAYGVHGELFHRFWIRRKNAEV